MPIKDSAKKYMKSSKRRETKNRNIKDRINAAQKEIKKLIEEKANSKKLNEAYKKVQKAVDKGASKNIVKKNTAARIKRKLFKSIYQAKK